MLQNGMVVFSPSRDVLGTRPPNPPPGVAVVGSSTRGRVFSFCRAGPSFAIDTDDALQQLTGLSGVAGRYRRRNGEQREHGWYVANYDGEIANVDIQIGRFLDRLEARGLLSNSLVILTADQRREPERAQLLL